MLTDVTPEALLGQQLNEFFVTSFDEMRVSLPKQVNVEAVIHRIEGLKSEDIEVEYDADYERCEIIVSGHNLRLVVSTDTLTVYSAKKTSPSGLLHLLKDVQGAVARLAGPVPFLLG